MSDVALSAFSKELVERLGEELETIDIIHHQIIISIRSHSLIKVMAILRDHSEYQFKQLTDICGADFPTRPKRFEVIYHLLSMRNNIRLRIKIYCAEEDTIPSLVPIFPNANWYEREVWDLYGITFEDHPDLRRIMTDYNFEGHPLRKDFPLTGYVEVRYDELLKRVVYEPVKLNQEYRVFDFLSPWEGMLGNYEGAPDPSLLKVSTTRLSGSEQAGKSQNPIDDKNTRDGK